MAQFMVVGTLDRAVEEPLRATVEIVSAVEFELGLLQWRLALLRYKYTFGSAQASLEQRDRYSPPRVEISRRTEVLTVYSISWDFSLAYTGEANYNEERLQRDAEDILAVFKEMEEEASNDPAS